MKRKWDELMEKRWAANAAALCIAVTFFALLMNLPGIVGALKRFFNLFTPIVIGIFLAYIINPFEKFIEKKLLHKIKSEKTRHILGVVLALLSIVAVIVLLLVALIPSVINSFVSLVNNMGAYVDNISANLENLAVLLEQYDVDIENAVERITAMLNDLVPDMNSVMVMVREASTKAGASASNWFFGIVLAVYFLMGKEKLLKGLEKLRRSALTEETYDRNSAFIMRCHNILTSYVGYDIIDGIIVGVINAIAMLIFRLPFVPLISVIVGVTNLVPTFGPLVGAVMGGIILVLNDPVQALIFLIITVVLQTLDGYVIKPKFFGSALGVSGVWILIAIIMGGKFFGIMGIVLSIPVVAIFTFVYEEAILPILAKKRDERKKKRDEARAREKE
ncbi:MAG: AI-2E family transporter [Lachnospiraceae bacterium]|nr:AI-2E family transporter [Lachnospiraceae bacterium]